MPASLAAVLAVVFPGQGSQSVGMALDFAGRFGEARAVLDEADRALALPLTRWIAEGPDELLRRTEVAQPAILAASIAIWRVVEARLPAPPGLFAGHSLGEYTALVAAGGLELADALRLVRRRGELMQQAVPEGEGGMAAVIGLAPDAVERVCAATAGVLAPANYNSPVQTVIAGERAALTAAREALTAAGARRIVELEVSAPFHCPLMAPAMEKLTPALAETCFYDLRVPVISNVTARPYRSAEVARTLLREQVCAPVRWVDGVRAALDAGTRVQLEVGPGEVLTGLAARIERGLVRAHVSTLDDLEGALARVQEALAS